MSFQVYQTVMDKQLTPYQHTMEDAPKLLRIAKSWCPDIWIRLPRHKWSMSWANIEDPVVPLERNLYGLPFAGLLWERQIEEVRFELGWATVPSRECLFVHRKLRLFLSVHVDDIKRLERSIIWLPCGRN